MKLKIPFDLKANNKLRYNLLNNIRCKKSKLNINFSQKKFLNSFENEVIEISNNKNSFKEQEKNENFIFNNMRKIKSSKIMSRQLFRDNKSNNSNLLIRINNGFNKNKNINYNKDRYKFQENKSINDIDYKKIKSNFIIFNNNFNSINNNINFNINKRIFSPTNKSVIKEDKKCNSVKDFSKYFEKKIKDKLRQITNFEDVNYCFRSKLLNIFPKNKTNENENINKITLDLKKNIKVEEINNNSNQRLSNIFKKNEMIKALPNNKENKRNNISELSQYIKEKVKKYYSKYNFSSIEDYFNDWLFYKRNNEIQHENYLDIEKIFIYLKEKLGLKISKEDIHKIFNYNKIYLDLENFKNFFFDNNLAKESLVITNNSKLKKLPFDLIKIDKDNHIFSNSSKDYLESSKREIYLNCDLLFNLLIKNKSKILDKIFNSNNGNFLKEGYTYNDFYNLINSLNLNVDKKIFSSEIIKKLFIKYQNSNKKLNLKYFINQLYENENSDKKEYYENNINKETNKIDNFKYKILKLNENNINAKEGVGINNKRYDININNNNLRKKEKNFITNNIDKKTEINIDFKTQKKYYQNKNEKIEIKSCSPSFKYKKNFNHYSDNSLDINKKKLNKSKEKNNIQKPKNRVSSFSDKNLKENSINTPIKSNKEDFILKEKEKNIKSIIFSNFKNKYKKEKINKNIKTKRFLYKTKLDIEKDNIKTKYLKRPKSTFNIRRKLKSNINNSTKYQISKIFRDSKIYYLNLDIIDLI